MSRIVSCLWGRLFWLSLAREYLLFLHPMFSFHIGNPALLCLVLTGLSPVQNPPRSYRDLQPSKRRIQVLQEQESYEDGSKYALIMSMKQDSTAAGSSTLSDQLDRAAGRSD